MDSFLTLTELKNINVKSIGKNVYISRHSNFYSVGSIEIGNNVRIDDFCILSGNIKIGNNVHISAGVFLYGGDAGIEICDNVNISPKSIIFAVSDDFSNSIFIGPMTNRFDLRHIIKKKVIFNKYSSLGAMSVVLPGGELGEGTAVGAMSLVKTPLDDWTVYCGVPCKAIKKKEKLFQ